MFDTYLSCSYTTKKSRQDIERTMHDDIYGNHYTGAWTRPLGRSYTTGASSIGTGGIRQKNSLLSSGEIASKLFSMHLMYSSALPPKKYFL